jgi:hypothetical protein
MFNGRTAFCRSRVLPCHFLTCPTFSSYSRETPSRFEKELLKALSNPVTSAIEIDSLNQILVNIGRPEDKLSDADLDLLLAEAGVEEKQRVDSC